jgi:hypothetical protein
MNKIIIAIFILGVHLNVLAQTDTIVIKNQKGFLFLSNYNYLYDKSSGEIRDIGFHDYFFPSNKFNKNWFIDSSKNFSFKKGLRVEFFKSRNMLKRKALLFKCVNQNNCYFYDNFYIIPVTINYKLYNDNWPLACRSNLFDIEVIGGSKLRFYHNENAIIPLRVSLINTNPKKKIK